MSGFSSGQRDGRAGLSVPGVAAKPGGSETAEEAIALRAWRRRYSWVVGLAGGGGLLLGGVVAEVLAARDGTWLSSWVVLLTVLGTTALLGVTAAVSWRVQSRGALRALMTTASPRTSSQVAKALRRGTLLPPEAHQVAQQVVDSRLRHRWRSWLLLALAVLWFGSGLLADGWERWFHVGLGVLYLPLWAFDRWDRQRVIRNAAAQGITASRPVGRSRPRPAGRPGSTD